MYVMGSHLEVRAEGLILDGYLTDHALNYLDRFDQSKGLFICLNQGPIKRKKAKKLNG